jgi:hypothetical protein
MLSIYVTSHPLSLHTVFHNVRLHYSMYYVFTPMQRVNVEDLARINENSAESDE